MSMETRTVVRKLLRAMADDEMATLVTAQQEILSRRKRLEGEWAQVKKRYSTAIEEANEELAENFDALRNGCIEDDVTCRATIDFAMGTLTVVRLDCEEVVEQRPLLEHERQGVLFNDGTDELLARVDAHLAECDAARIESVTQIPASGPEEAAPEAAEVAVPFPGEVLAGEQSSDASYWEAKKVEALGGIDAKVAVRDYGFGKNWCATAAMQSAISEQLQVSMPVAAFHMGAHAKVAGMKVGRNPFVADGAEDQVNFDAWALGWGTVAALELKVNTATLNMAAEATTKKRGDIDDWPRVDGVRVSPEGVIHPEDCTALPRFKSKEGSGGGGVVRVKGKWYAHWEVEAKTGGGSSPAYLEGEYWEDARGAVEAVGARIRKGLDPAGENEKLAAAVVKWVGQALEAVEGVGHVED